MHVINCLKETAPGPGFHVDVVAQLLSTETMTNAIMSPFLYNDEIPFHIYEGYVSH